MCGARKLSSVTTSTKRRPSASCQRPITSAAILMVYWGRRKDLTRKDPGNWSWSFPNTTTKAPLWEKLLLLNNSSSKNDKWSSKCSCSSIVVPVQSLLTAVISTVIVFIHTISTTVFCLLVYGHLSEVTINLHKCKNKPQRKYTMKSIWHTLVSCWRRTLISQSTVIADDGGGSKLFDNTVFLPGSSSMVFPCDIAQELNEVTTAHSSCVLFSIFSFSGVEAMWRKCFIMCVIFLLVNTKLLIGLLKYSCWDR